MNPKLSEFLDIWEEVSSFIAPEFQPAVFLKKDYYPYGSDLPCKALIFDDKYAAFVIFREWEKGTDEVVRLEVIDVDEIIRKRYEDEGMDASLISDCNMYPTAFFLVQTILNDWQEKLRIEGKK